MSGFDVQIVDLSGLAAAPDGVQPAASGMYGCGTWCDGNRCGTYCQGNLCGNSCPPTGTGCGYGCDGNTCGVSCPGGNGCNP